MRNLLTVLAGVCFIELAPSISAAEGCNPFEMFIPSSTVVDAGGFEDMAVADFDGDGAPDAALVRSTAVVEFGNGDGSFSDEVSFQIPCGSRAVAATDLDLDGRPDLVLAGSDGPDCSRAGGLWVVRNEGARRFTTPQFFSLGTDVDVYRVVAGDMDGKNGPDIVVTSRGQTLVLLNRGDGTFGQPAAYPVSGYPIVLGDFDGDGSLDVAEGRNLETQDILIFLNQGDGVLSVHDTFSAGWTAGLDAADLDGDGDLDLAAGSGGGHAALSVLMNTGDADFIVRESYSIGGTVGSVRAADLDHDGAMDLVLANPSNLCISLLFNRGNGLFDSDLHIAIGGFSRIVSTADLNGDGQIDLLAAHQTVNQIVGILNRGRRLFHAPGAVVAMLVPKEAVWGDFDGDGDLDPAVSSYNLDEDISQSKVFQNRGSLRFEERQVFGRSQFLGAGDLEGDGHLDLLGYSEEGFSYFRNNGNGSFARPVKINESLVQDLLVRDLNRDGKVDLAIASSNNQIIILKNEGTFIFSETAVPVGPDPIAVDAGDLDGDDILDLAAANSGSNTISILIGKGDGTFLPHQDLPVPRWPTSLALADLDGDRLLDIVTTQPDSNSVSLLYNLGGAQFLSFETRSAGLQPHEVVAGDITGDGLADLVVANDRSYDLSLFLSNGQGSLSGPETLSFGVPGHDLSLADIDGDGKLDLAMVGELVLYEGTVPVFLNHGVPAGCPMILRFVRGDLNQDGKVDISDAVDIIDSLFRSPSDRACLKAGDANDDGALNISDPVALLEDLFLTPGPLPEPFPGCGMDPTPDSLGCRAYLSCP